MPNVNKAVIPVAGLGTRFLPATKATPKEMLPIVDKPLMQYAIEEATAAGIGEFVIVTSPDKGSIEDHFRRNEKLESELKAKNKTKEAAAINFLPEGVRFSSVIQQQPLGLGHAVLCARELVGDEPFAVILPDDLIFNDNEGCLQQMVRAFENYQGAIVAVENVDADKTDRYGIVSIEPVDGPVSLMTGIVEKPKPDVAPSTLGVVGRYILPGKIFGYLENTDKGAGNEIQLTDAIAALLKDEKVYAFEFEGERYDCGSKLGYLQANVEYGLRDEEIKKAFSEYLKKVMSTE